MLYSVGIMHDMNKHTDQFLSKDAEIKIFIIYFWRNNLLCFVPFQIAVNKCQRVNTYFKIYNYSRINKHILREITIANISN